MYFTTSGGGRGEGGVEAISRYSWMCVRCTRHTDVLCCRYCNGREWDVNRAKVQLLALICSSHHRQIRRSPGSSDML